MNQEPDPQLERWTHGNLRRLPELSAPPSLLPRVLAALQAEARLPWWRQSWWRWPLAAKVAALAVFLASATALSFLGASIQPAADSLSTALDERLGIISHLWIALAALGGALETLLLSLAGNPWVLAAGAGCTALYLLSIAAGTVLVRYASREAGGLRHEK